MFDAVSLGELLIDFTEYGKSPNGNALYQRNAGGATANVMADLSAMGHQTAFIGKVGKDDCGKFLKNTLEKILNLILQQNHQLNSNTRTTL